MKKIVIEATANTTAMPLFGAEHLLPVLLLVLFIVFLAYLKKSSIPQASQDNLGRGLAWVLFFSFPTYVALQLLDGSVSWNTALPLYPCPLASLAAPLLIRSKNTTLFNVIFYWVFAGTLQAVITPEVKSTFPHYEYFYFWVCHAGLLGLLLFTLVIQDKEPTLRGVVSAFIWLNVFVVISAIVNSLLGSNYYYLSAKPTVPTLMDYLGPWPWYILGVETVALIQFVLSFGIFWVVKKKLLRPRPSIVTVNAGNEPTILTTLPVTNAGGFNGAR